jgi:ferredoxin-nitrite reductase
MSGQNGSDFTVDQKRYLEGFVSGVQAARITKGLAPISSTPANSGTGEKAPGGAAAPMGPDAAHLAAQDRFAAGGKKLVAEEKAKRDEHPFDIYARMKKAARDDQYPKGVDVFRWKFHGLFYVAPAHDSFMCRLRIPNGMLNSWQFRGIADLAERYGGGYAHITTRANLQIREIEAAHGIAMLEGLSALGLTGRGAGADNIRNVTGSPTAGIDPGELLDTRPYAREWHYHILNDRSLYGLPRKFNVAFDGGGRIPVLEETNDIGFQAVRVAEGASLSAGVYFRLALGGITGHKDLARDTGVLLPPDDATEVADAVVRVFIDHGDRTNRQKARLKYLLDAWGFEKFLAAVEQKLGRTLPRVAAELCAPRPPFDRMAHVGAHPQAQPGMFYLGVVTPVGRLTSAQMREIAAVAGEWGDGDIRLTVWQNFLLSGLPEDRVSEAQRRIEAIGLDWRPHSIRAGLVACTGNKGCRFSASDTKGHALAIADHLETRVALDQPVNIHLTGCHNSCAQHYIGDIGLLGVKVAVDADGEETVEGYHVHVGGGFAADQAIGRELYRDVKAEDLPTLIERMLGAYLARRDDEGETFRAFTARHSIEHLKALFGPEGI